MKPRSKATTRFSNAFRMKNWSIQKVRTAYTCAQRAGDKLRKHQVTWSSRENAAWMSPDLSNKYAVASVTSYLLTIYINVTIFKTVFYPWRHNLCDDVTFDSCLPPITVMDGTITYVEVLLGMRSLKMAFGIIRNYGAITCRTSHCKKPIEKGCAWCNVEVWIK